MILARCNFGACPKSLAKESFEDMVHEYFAALLQNWQVLDHYDLAWLDNTLFVYTPLPRKDAIADFYHSSLGQMSLDKINDMTKSVPTWEVLDDQSEEELDSIEDIKSLVLFTSFLEIGSPLICLTTRKPIAIFSLEIPEKLRNDIYFWRKRYHIFDSLFMDSSALEVESYKQIADHESELSREGLKICKNLEKITGIESYYYLHRYAGKAGEGLEFDRPCPICGEVWLVIRKSEIDLLHHKPLDFSFQCKNCRLVSHHPQCTDDQRLASIGLNLPD